MKKRLISVLLMFLLVLSTVAFADDNSGNCAGFWGSVKCFLWGDAENRAGKSWWDRGNVAGEAISKGEFTYSTCTADSANPKICAVKDLTGNSQGYALLSETKQKSQTLYDIKGNPVGSCTEGNCLKTGIDPNKMVVSTPPVGSTYQESTSLKSLTITPKGEVYQLNDFGTWNTLPPPPQGVVTVTQPGVGTKSFLVGKDSKAVEVKVTQTESYTAQGTDKPVYQSASGTWLNSDGTAFSGKVQETIGMGAGKVYQVNSQGKTEATLVPVPTVQGSSTVYVKVGAGESITDKVINVNGKPMGDFVDAGGIPMYLTSKGYALTAQQAVAVGKKLKEQGIIGGVNVIDDPKDITPQYLAALEQQGTFETDAKGGLGFKTNSGKVNFDTTVAQVDTSQEIIGLSGKKAATGDFSSDTQPSVAANEKPLQPATPGYTYELPKPGTAAFQPLTATSGFKQGVTYKTPFGNSVSLKEDGKFYTPNGVPYAGTEVIASNGVKYGLDANGKGTVVATFVPVSHENLKSTEPVYLKVGTDEKIQDLVSFSAKEVPQGDHFVDSSGNKLYVTSKGAVVTEQQMLATQKALEGKGVDLGVVAAVGADDKDAFNKKLLAALEQQQGEFESTSEGLVFKPFEGETALVLKEEVPNVGDVGTSISALSSQAKKKELVVTEIPKSEVAKKGPIFSTAEEEAAVKATQAKIATETATKLFKAGADDFWGTDEEAIFKALDGKSPEEIELIKAKYKEITKGNDLDADMKSELNDEEYAKYVGLTEVGVAKEEQKLQQEQAETEVLIAEAEKAAAFAEAEKLKSSGEPRLAEGETGKSGQAGVEPSEYLDVKIKAVAGEGEVVSAAGAVQQASPKALQNPEQYEVTFDGKSATLIMVEESGVKKQVYYSSADIDGDGFPKAGSKPIAVNPETVLVVHKKPAYQEMAGEIAAPKKGIEPAVPLKPPEGEIASKKLSVELTPEEQLAQAKHDYDISKTFMAEVDGKEVEFTVVDNTHLVDKDGNKYYYEDGEWHNDVDFWFDSGFNANENKNIAAGVQNYNNKGLAVEEAITAQGAAMSKKAAAVDIETKGEVAAGTPQSAQISVDKEVASSIPINPAAQKELGSKDKPTEVYAQLGQGKVVTVGAISGEGKNVLYPDGTGGYFVEIVNAQGSLEKYTHVRNTGEVVEIGKTTPQTVLAFKTETTTQVAAGTPTTTVKLGSTVTKPLIFETLETAQLMDDLKSGANSGQYYEDNPAVVDDLYKKGLLTEEQYAEINGDGVFNVQGTLADAQAIVQQKSGLVKKEWKALSSAEQGQFGSQEKFEQAKVALLSGESGALTIAEGQANIQNQKDLALSNLADNRALTQDAVNSLKEKAAAETDPSAKQFYLDAAQKAEEQVQKYDEAIAAVEQGKYKDAANLDQQAEALGTEANQLYAQATGKPKTQLAGGTPTGTFPVSGGVTPLSPPIDSKKITDAAKALDEAGIGSWGTDEQRIYDTIGGMSEAEVAALKVEYKKQTGNDLEADMKDELSTDEYAKISDKLSAPKAVAAAQPATQPTVEPKLATGTQLTDFQKENLPSDVAAALEKKGKANVEAGEYSVDSNGNVIFKGKNNGAIFKFGKTKQESELVQSAQGEPGLIVYSDSEVAASEKLAQAQKNSNTKQAAALKAEKDAAEAQDTLNKFKAEQQEAQKKLDSATADLTAKNAALAACDTQLYCKTEENAVIKAETEVSLAKTSVDIAADLVTKAVAEAKEKQATALAKSNEAKKAKQELAEAAEITVKVGQTVIPPAAPLTPQPQPEKTAAENAQQVLQDLADNKLTHNEAAEKLAKFVPDAKKEYEESSDHKNYVALQQSLSGAGIKGTTIPADISKEKLNAIGNTLGLQQGTMSDDAYREAINKKIAEYREKDGNLKRALDEIEKKQEAVEAQKTYLFNFEKLQNNPTYASIKEYGSKVGDFATFMSKLGSYSALSNMAFGSKFSQNWLINSNNEFLNTWSDLPGYFARSDLICDYDSKQRASRPGQSSVFIHQPGGVFQFVGSIQAEKSPVLSSILCERNTQENATEEWLCSPGQVCVENYCYKGEDPEAIDPDVDKPAQGYFYKLTWTVTAPSDKSFTPYFDEDGVSVKFNLQLNPGGKWIYKQLGSEPMEVWNLKNGASQSAVIVKYLPENYNKACIKFHPDYRIIDSEGDGVGEICADFISTGKGLVEYSSSDQTGSVYTSSGSSSAQVVMDI